jgi:uracil-DNA glycosylase family 4
MRVVQSLNDPATLCNQMMENKYYDRDCRRCSRLASFLDTVHERYPDYHARPVAPFGPLPAALLIVGLAPGMHGANASGRPFTGDYAGILLFSTLHAFGFASRADVQGRDDGLALHDCRLTNAVKCLPPQNRPIGSEIRNCNGFLAAEIAATQPRVILALGRVAHEAVLRAQGYRLREYAFAHGAEHLLANGIHLHDSYHCSRYNTQTRRLTPDMFTAVVASIRRRLDRRDAI